MVVEEDALFLDNGQELKNILSDFECFSSDSPLHVYLVHG